jgi:hypothetical protein
MRRFLVVVVLVAVAAAASAQNGPGPGGDNRRMPQDGLQRPMQTPMPTPLPEPRPAPRVQSLSSLDYALPKLSDEERAFALTEGYVCTVGPTRFLCKGQDIDELAFMHALGLDTYVASVKSYRRWNGAWIAASCLMVAGLTAEFIVAESTGAAPSGLEICTAIGLGVSITGGSINYLQKPRPPYFQSLAYQANEANRKLMASREAKP